jgi:hypothetical protein
MVGIAAGKGFMALRNVDQFALLGIRPTTKLSFEELLKQAIRVAVLLHPDKVPPNVDPPFTSATANDLKSWLQLNGTSEADQKKAFKLFYANTVGHCGLTWQPCLKDKNGALASRTDPAIWRLPGSTPPPSPPPKERKRKLQSEVHGTPIPDKKQKTQDCKPGSQKNSHRINVPRPEKLRKKSDVAPNFRKKPDHSNSTTSPKPEERAQTTSGTTPSSRKRPDRSSSDHDQKPETKPKKTSNEPSVHQREDYPQFPPDFWQYYSHRPEESAQTSTPNSHAGTKTKDYDRRSEPPSNRMSQPPDSPPHASAQKADCSENADHAVPERERRTYGTKPGARTRSSWFQNASGPVQERRRNTYATKPMFREDFNQADTPHTPPHPSHAATPEQAKAFEGKDDVNVPAPKRDPTSEHREEFEPHDDVDVQSRRYSLPPQSPPPTPHTLENLVGLAHTVGDPTRGRVAIACLPEEQDRVVVMQFHPSYQVRYCVERFDVHGQIRVHDGPYFTTYKHILSGEHKFLGRFAGATEAELKCFASMLYFMNDNASQINADVLPYGDRSPSWKSEG